MFECAMAEAVGLLGSQLRIEILRQLVEKHSLSLAALQPLFIQADAQLLIATLNGLKKENLIFQKKDSDEYALSDFGRNLVPILGLLGKWSQGDSQS